MQGHGWSPRVGTLTMDTCSRTCSKPARPQLCQGPAAPAAGGSAQPWDGHWDTPGDSRWWLCSGEGQGGTLTAKHGVGRALASADLPKIKVAPGAPSSSIAGAAWGHCQPPSATQPCPLCPGSQSCTLGPLLNPSSSQPHGTGEDMGTLGQRPPAPAHSPFLLRLGWKGHSTPGTACAAGGASGKGRSEPWMLPAAALPCVLPPCSAPCAPPCSRQSLHSPAPSRCPPGLSGTDGPGPCPSPVGDQRLKPAQKATSLFEDLPQDPQPGGGTMRAPRPRKDRAGLDPCPDTRSSILLSLEHSPKQQAAGPCSSSVLPSWGWQEPGQGVLQQGQTLGGLGRVLAAAPQQTPSPGRTGRRSPSSGAG
ncbi:translation initiation factor IF-2-like [Passer montanus]|uniref:translation initiation factor IF-2-like n=1 Tax=Passer montanus TaxID=9160 RepID=UPI00195FC9EE|nr:translation initiation factor IF-2-like [Passer montanus]